MHPIDTSRVIGNSVLALSMLARLASPIELIIGSYQKLPGTRNRKRIKPNMYVLQNANDGVPANRMELGTQYRRLHGPGFSQPAL